jgi:hypothetical protein
VVDRADVPAVVARRQLADQAAHEPARPVARCVVPDWFPALLEDARRSLADAKERRDVLHARHDEIEAAVAAAAEQLDVVARDTADDREALAAARRRADEARWAVGAAERRLEGAGWRQRRPLRQALDEARQRQERASEYLARVEARTAPAVERYAEAVVEHRRAQDDRGTQRALVQLDGLDLDVPSAATRVQALEWWGRWARGEPVPDRQLQVTLQGLGRMSPTAQTRHLIGELANDPAIVDARAQRSPGVRRGPDRYPGFEFGSGRPDGMDLSR